MMLSGNAHHNTFMVSVPKQRKFEFDLNIQGKHFLAWPTSSKGIKLYNIQDKKKARKVISKCPIKNVSWFLKIKNI